MDLSGCTHVINKLSECIQCEDTGEWKWKNNQAKSKEKDPYKNIQFFIMFSISNSTELFIGPYVSFCYTSEGPIQSITSVRRERESKRERGKERVTVHQYIEETKII